MGRMSTTTDERTPYRLVARAVTPEQATKAELLRLSRELEQEALAHPPVAAGVALQDARHLSGSTLAAYRRLAEGGTQVRMFARGLQAWLGNGVQGTDLSDDDPLVDEWLVVLQSPEAPVVLAATDLHGPPDDPDRAYLMVFSRDPALVDACVRALGLA